VASPHLGYEQLAAQAERWEPGADGIVFLPYLAGERTPHSDPGAHGSFTGLSLRHDRGALVRAVLEGVAFALRDCLDALPASSSGAALGRVRGGGARSDLWLRIVASVLDMPLERTAVDEGAAFGAALLGGVAAGIWRDPAEAIAATVRTTGQIDPEPRWTERYAELRVRYRALYPAIRNAEQ
jgi:xylulokinase